MSHLDQRLAVAVIALVVLAAPVPARTQPRPAAPAMVEWLAPAAATAQPQNEAQKKAGMQHGRVLPTPEVLQPQLDPALPAYVPRAGRTLSGSFRAAASDVLPALAHAWIEAFRKYYPRVSIRLSPPYAGSLGAQELIAGKLDVVFVSRELRPEDIAGFEAKFSYPPLSVPIAGGSYRHYGFLDAVGFFVNKDNPLEKIGFEQLDEILSRTHYRSRTAITTWGELGLTGDWADKPIHVYAVRPWNGFEEFVRERVLSRKGQRGEWREDLHFDDVVFPLAKRVAQDRYGLGYSGLAFIDAPVKMLPLAVDSAGSYVPPSYESVALATYPLSRLIYLNLRKRPGVPLNPAIEELLRFILSRDGQQLVRNEAIFLPLRASQARASRALLEP
jgi:phosphate transport system substrate-binding protein